MTTDELKLDMRGMRKRFGNLQALDMVDFSICGGEIHALLGENGAGKSTLMKVLFGLCRPDGGEITLNGTRLDLTSPRDAIRAGIGMVHQHFHLVETFTVAENVVLGAGRAIPESSASARLDELAAQLGLDDVLPVRIERLSAGVRQRVEILKALYRQARIVLLDEPTSVLTPQETRELFRTLAALRTQGVAIVFITHKLQEVLQVSDRITVMRRGRVVAARKTEDMDRDTLSSLMVGQAVPAVPHKRIPPGVETRLKAHSLSLSDGSGREVLAGISLEIRVGEIFGIAGIDGNGQVELAESLAGLLPASGDVYLDGEPLPVGRRRRAASGISYIPQDRRNEGLAMEMTLAENSVLGQEQRSSVRWGPFLLPSKLRSHAARLMQEFDIRASGPTALAGSLSGGNQQKLLVARELSLAPRLLIAVNPTWGLDIGAIGYIHKTLVALRENGGSVLLISNELDELYALCDRLAVIYNGRLSAPLSTDTPYEQVGLLMAGIGLD